MCNVVKFCHGFLYCNTGYGRLTQRSRQFDLHGGESPFPSAYNTRNLHNLGATRPLVGGAAGQKATPATYHCSAKLRACDVNRCIFFAKNINYGMTAPYNH